ncbi:MAG: hypothetical protein A2161_03530 [Candidatus Schekmanbacteria bacterium RBG_13_48_7]|uniref:Glycosyl transferase family 1 n=1 Tax=Candidatus Schekmanbacteria bacterium RBG_13_48_7 TaxID=1817878 RepID=A0A1F7S9D1_9BACT|nr:MAG: hypothetical protein A2161_03530 [Candidatus Schekmanbacteria bacterium RBG_13_48_7]
MKRILFVNSHKEIGGGEIVLINLLKSINKTQFTLVVTTPGTGQFQSAIEKLGVPVKKLTMSQSQGRGSRFQIFMNMFRFALSFLFTIPKLISLIKSEQIDIVHAGTFQSLLYTLPAARLTGKHLIWHCHEFYLYGRIGPQFMKRADYIIATSHALRKNLIEAGIPGEKITTIYCSVDSRIFESASKPNPAEIIPAWKQGDRILTVIGRLVHFKGQDILIEAAHHVLKHFPDTWFLIVGGPLFTGLSFMEYLKTLGNRLGISDRIVFLGQRDDVPAIITLSDIIVLPSRAEPFGISALEGMMAGKPVIVTVTSGVSEIVSHKKNGYIVPAFNPGALADAIMELLDDSSIADHIGKNAQIYVKTNYIPCIMAKKIEQILLESALNL